MHSRSYKASGLFAAGMKTIKDSVHDHIPIDGVALELLDTPSVQRLRHVRQLGTVHLVYPSANHTRFEHSLGVYHLAKEALRELGVEGPAAAHVEAAALLHDIGHAPFSHNLEELLARETGRYHDEVGYLLKEGQVGVVLRDHGLDPTRVARLIAGRGRYGQLVSGELDVDRMDYLVRDAHHTGVPYGTIDHARLVRELRFVDDELVLAPGNVETAESLLVARALMNPTVYNHHVARISKTMLQRATERYLRSTRTDPEAVQRMDDHDLLVALRETDASATLGRRVTQRDLYKRAVWLEYRDVPEWVLAAAPTELRELEADIAEEAGLDPVSVLIDRPPEPTMRESTSRIMVGGDIVRLGERSPLVRALRTIQEEQWRFGVYAPVEHLEAVATGTLSVLDLSPESNVISEIDVGRYARLDDFRTSD